MKRDLIFSIVAFLSVLLGCSSCKKEKPFDNLKPWVAINAVIFDCLQKSEIQNGKVDKLQCNPDKNFIELKLENNTIQNRDEIIKIMNDFVSSKDKRRKSNSSASCESFPTYYNRTDNFNSAICIKNEADSLVVKCGESYDSCKFVNDSVSVYSSSLVGIGDKFKMYETIYRIHFDKFEKYALCKILINKKEDGGEIKLIQVSNCLIDLIMGEAKEGK